MTGVLFAAGKVILSSATAPRPALGPTQWSMGDLASIKLISHFRGIVLKNSGNSNKICFVLRNKEM
jgi:hypothetical protein